MGFSCGIIGLPNVGKSTLFNALTQSNNAEAANYPFATIEPNIGRVVVPDSRIKELSKISKSQKTIPAFLDFVDIAGLVKGASKGEGLGNKFLSHIKNVDAVAHIVRCFDDKNITHIKDTINPIEDIEIINTELLLADLQTLQNSKESIVKKAKSGDKEIEMKLKIISNLTNKIEKGEKANINEFFDKEKLYVKELNLITLKPYLYICNINEASIINGNNFSDKVKSKALEEKASCIIASASIESQIANLDEEEDKLSMLKEFGLKKSALENMINSGYELLDLITFFTSGPKETRAWTLKKGLKAPSAAGKIHTDFEKGFIRAETISYEDFIEFKGEVGCKERGKMRLEGKDYQVKNGDVFHFLFNI